MEYYVYILANPCAELPFYVGVGKETKQRPVGFRPRMHIHEAIAFRDRGKQKKHANYHKLHTIINILEQGSKISIEIIASKMTKPQAIAKEIALIKQYGRRDLGTGCLTNLTNGGEGFNFSSESIEKRSAQLRGRPSHAKGKVLGPYNSERVKKAADGIREFHRKNPGYTKGKECKPLSDGHRKKLSERFKGRVSPMKGRVSPKKGIRLTDAQKAERRLSMKPHPPRTPHNKGKPSPNRGRTYEEMYGPEKAAELKRIKADIKLAYWREKDNALADQSMRLT